MRLTLAISLTVVVAAAPALAVSQPAPEGHVWIKDAPHQPLLPIVELDATRQPNGDWRLVSTCSDSPKCGPAPYRAVHTVVLTGDKARRIDSLLVDLRTAPDPRPSDPSKISCGRAGAEITDGAFRRTFDVCLDWGKALGELQGFLRNQ